jgi:hypothetical protein
VLVGRASLTRTPGFGPFRGDGRGVNRGVRALLASLGDFNARVPIVNQDVGQGAGEAVGPIDTGHGQAIRRTIDHRQHASRRGSRGTMNHRVDTLSLRAAVTVLASVMLCSGCGGGSTSDDSGNGPAAEASDVGAIRAQYRLTFGEDDDWYALYEVVTEAGEGTRVELTVPVDRPVTVYRVVWDGHRVLEAGDEAKDLSYTLYEAPEEEEGLLDFVNLWVLDPDSEAFARVCPEADPLDDTREIAGRSAIGFRCEVETGQGTLWIDRETHLLLLQSGVPGEGGEPGTFRAERVTLDAPTDAQTFWTQPPAGADVDVVEATGITPPPPEEPKSAAELEAILRDIAATTDSPTPIYYVGREFAGEPLSDVVIYNSASGGEAEGDATLDRGQGLWIMYGDRFTIDTRPYGEIDFGAAVGCSRKADLRGVPTVWWSDGTTLFTQDAVIRLSDTAGKPRKAAAAAQALREADEEQPSDVDLIRPSADVIAGVDQGCGQKPGEHGPMPED